MAPNYLSSDAMSQGGSRPLLLPPIILQRKGKREFLKSMLLSILPPAYPHPNRSFAYCWSAIEYGPVL